MRPQPPPFKPKFISETTNQPPPSTCSTCATWPPPPAPSTPGWNTTVAPTAGGPAVRRGGDPIRHPAAEVPGGVRGPRPSAVNGQGATDGRHVVAADIAVRGVGVDRFERRRGRLGGGSRAGPRATKPGAAQTQPRLRHRLRMRDVSGQANRGTERHPAEQGERQQTPAGLPTHLRCDQSRNLHWTGDTRSTTCTPPTSRPATRASPGW